MQPILRRTLLTGVAPGGAHGAAALGPGRRDAPRLRADAGAEAVEAQLLAHVLALFAVGAQHEAGRAVALERARAVDAVAVAAQLRVDQALVDVCPFQTVRS